MKKTLFILIASIAIIHLSTSCIFESPKVANIKDVIDRALPLEDTVKVSSGTIDRYQFKSVYVDARNVDVWLPKDYSINKKYSVLYMHDGQMLYDASGSWNSAEWEVDETVTKLLNEGTIQDVIVVGIWHNSHKRHLEYFPQAAIDSIAEPQYSILLGLMPEKPQADMYLEFLVKELKPFIDHTYSVRTDTESTFIAGSSMGGLISLYAICEYPEIFGGAACISTHWIGTFDNNKEIPEGINKYLKAKLPNPQNHRIYFDYGTIGLDANYEEYQKIVDQTVKESGYNDQNWMTKAFEGADHNEKYWSKRLHIPFTFLLKK